MIDTKLTKNIERAGSKRIKRTLMRPIPKEDKRKILALKEKANLIRINHETVCVYKILSILTKQIEPKYCQRPRNYWLIQIHKKPNSKYFQLFCGIHKYLVELKGSYSNPTDGLIFDYLSCIYKYYKEYRRAPSLHQLRPYESNQVLFIEWISEWERDRDEDYWITQENAELGDVSESVDEILGNNGKIIIGDIGITETKRG